MPRDRRHRPQHESSPTWCRDCGKFDPDPEEQCPAAGKRLFDATTERGSEKIISNVFGGAALGVNRGPTS